MDNGDTALIERAEQITREYIVVGDTYLTVADDTPYEVWHGTVQHLLGAAKRLPWLVGDALNRGEELYGEDFSQVLPDTKYDDGTLRNMKWVAGVMPLSCRRDKLTFAHHQEVAPVMATSRSKAEWFLDEAEDLGWSSKRLRAEVREYLRSLKRQQQLEELAAKQQVDEETGEVTTTTYQVVMVTPPWPYDFAEADTREAIDYPTMTVAEICSYPVSDIGADDSVLFLWSPPSRLADALHALEGWGYEYRTNVVWDKMVGGSAGNWTKGQHELLLMGKRGDNAPIPLLDARPESVIQAYSSSLVRHKPKEFYEIIEAMFPDIAKIEVFSDAARPEGWTTVGSDR